MRKVYVITCTTQASRLCEFTLSVVEWVFTSKKVANKQLDIIKDKIENGGWWSDCNGKPLLGKVLRDTNMEKNYMGVLRDVFIETPNGIHEVFRLQERELNSGIYLTD
jgi:hypothetical protein